MSLMVHHLPRNHHFKIYGQRTIKDVKKFKIPICSNWTTDFLVVIIFFFVIFALLIQSYLSVYLALGITRVCALIVAIMVSLMGPYQSLTIQTKGVRRD